ncbi:MAG TPA: glycosyltransferase N-terminal domain-containing protein [Daejeonella sp.]|nr:glycosyltransferase N-terminal domain-containing protein [Daejeonella sp.]
MLFLYDLSIQLYKAFVWIASLKNAKARLWIQGRRSLLQHIAKEVKPNVQYTWFHFASLGEFEQGRPVLEQLKSQQPDSHILITFFSPSGYQIRKNYPLADHVFYLPIDTAQNAREFIRLINPKMAVFTKYEYWYQYFNELHQQQIPLYVISAIFRKNQPFFKWYGSLNRRMLKCVSHFFVQNEESIELLKEIGLQNASLSGDTRFDRVAKNAQNPQKINIVERFCNNRLTFIAGSTWPEDEELISQLSKTYAAWKFIIAPHEIGEEKIKALESRPSGRSIRYSEAGQNANLNQYQTIIIDNIGMLSSLYQYAHIAYIGGGFGKGIHNTLEAAAFGLPLIFGPEYGKFKEAKDLIKLGAAFSIKNYSELNTAMEKLTDENYRSQKGIAAKEYVETNTGATGIILNQISDHS